MLTSVRSTQVADIPGLVVGASENASSLQCGMGVASVVGFERHMWYLFIPKGGYYQQRDLRS